VNGTGDYAGERLDMDIPRRSTRVNKFDLKEWANSGEQSRKGSTFRKSKQVPKRNDPCLCGSGRKFKKCCLNKGKPQSMTAAAKAVSPEEMAERQKQRVMAAMRRRDTHEALVFAYQVTGKIVNKINRETVDEETVEKWDFSVKTYCEENEVDLPPGYSHLSDKPSGLVDAQGNPLTSQ
jgi:hypothetical protein